MAAEDTHNKVLEYLKKEGAKNTFRLARDLNIERHKLLNVIEKLEEKGVVEIKHGLVKFLSFLMEEKKPEKSVEVTVAKAKKTLLKKAKRVKKRHKQKTGVSAGLQAENKQLKEKLLELEETVKRLEKKPKTIIKTIVRKVPVIKEIPVTKTIIKKVPVLPSPPPPKKKKKKRRKKVEKKPKIRSKKFKLPKFKFMKGITKLKRPEFDK